MFSFFFTSTKMDLKLQIGESILCLYLINYFELSNIDVIARRLNLHISDRFTLGNLSECFCIRGVFCPPFL